MKTAYREELEEVQDVLSNAAGDEELYRGYPKVEDIRSSGGNISVFSALEPRFADFFGRGWAGCLIGKRFTEQDDVYLVDGEPYEIRLEFDVPARFDTDMFEAMRDDLYEERFRLRSVGEDYPAVVQGLASALLNRESYFDVFDDSEEQVLTVHLDRKGDGRSIGIIRNTRDRAYEPLMEDAERIAEYLDREL